jgi:HD superfamily phosphohydrolase
MNKPAIVIPESIKEVIKWLPKSDFHMREKAFIHHASKGVEAYIVMGAILCKSRDEEDWSKAKCQNMKEYCENEMRISYTQAIRMMTIWDKLGEKLVKYYDQIMSISFVNLYEVARIAHTLNESQLSGLLDQAAVDTERGFKNNLRQLEGKRVPTDMCDHINVDKWFFKCKRCQQIIPIELPELKKKIGEQS